MGANNHPTTVPQQLQNVEMPENPIETWSDSVLKNVFAEMHHDHMNHGRGAWLTVCGLEQMREELLDRGISPVKVVAAQSPAFVDSGRSEAEA